MTDLRKTARRSAAIAGILLLAVLCGFLYQQLWDKIDRARYPRDYSEYVSEYASVYGVPEYIVYAVIRTESGFVSNAQSQAGAIGLMQITPDTFDWLSMLMKRQNDSGMLYDPRTNIEYGTYFLSYLYMRYNRWDTVFAAYNAGAARVDGWLAEAEYTDKEGRLAKIPFDETRKYVKKVNDAIHVYKRLYYSEETYS